MRLEIKGPPEEYVTLNFWQRILRWKWWFLILVVIGIIAALISFLGVFADLQKSGISMQEPLVSPALSVAFLQIANTSTSSGPAPDPNNERSKGIDHNDPFRPYVMVGIFSLMGLITLVSLLAVLFSSNEKAVTTASDILKTCIGFFIGVATGYF